MSAAGEHDFAIAARLCNALLLAPDLAHATVERHCRDALGADSAVFLDGDARAPAAWSVAAGHCRQTRSPYYSPRQLAAPLIVGGGPVALLLVAKNQGFADDEPARFDELVLLLRDALAARADLDARRKAMGDLQQRLEQQSAILDHIRDTVITMDLGGYVTSWNKGAERVLGYTADEAIGQHILFIYADEHEDEDRPFNLFLEDSSREFTVRRRRKSGAEFWASITLSLMRSADGTPTGMLGYLIDISERLATEAQLQLHARIFERSTEAIIVTDAAFRTVSVNRAFTEITGFAADEVAGEVPSVLRPCSFESELMLDLRAALERNDHWQGELWDWRKSEEIFPAWVSINAVRDDHGKLTHYFLVMSDITERKEAEHQIYRLAYFDALTGLPNRAMLYSLVAQAISEAQRVQGHGALLLVDINRFKDFNDSFGHDAADRLLQEIAQRLSTTLRAEDVVARMGGDEFVIALFDISRRDHASIVAQKIGEALATPFQVEGFEVVVSTAIGIAVFPDDGSDCEALVRCADVAMMRAKEHASQGFVFYSQEMQQRSIVRLQTEAGLRRALARDELVLHYQPQIDLQSGALLGAEALIRWQHPERGLLPPREFVPIAEDTGLIGPIGDWVIAETCRQIAAWRAAGLPSLRVAVNISSRQFRPDLAGKVAEILRRFGVEETLLELELTESMLMHNAEEVIGLMGRLRAGGLSLSLDDFGTGYSSLAYLKRFPIDKLKIDQSFVQGLPGDAQDGAIARTIIGLGHNLGLKVLAEGVETQGQADFLRAAGCDQAQGYLFGKAIAGAAFVHHLARPAQR